MSYYTVYYYHFENFQNGPYPIIDYRDVAFDCLSDFISELKASGHVLISLCLKGDLPFICKPEL